MKDAPQKRVPPNCFFDALFGAINSLCTICVNKCGNPEDTDIENGDKLW